MSSGWALGLNLVHHRNDSQRAVVISQASYSQWAWNRPGLDYIFSRIWNRQAAAHAKRMRHDTQGLTSYPSLLSSDGALGCPNGSDPLWTIIGQPILSLSRLTDWLFITNGSLLCRLHQQQLILPWSCCWLLATLSEVTLSIVQITYLLATWACMGGLLHLNTISDDHIGLPPPPLLSGLMV